MPKGFDSWASWSSQSSNILYPHSGRKRSIMTTNNKMMNEKGFSAKTETIDEIIFDCMKPKKLKDD